MKSKERQIAYRAIGDFHLWISGFEAASEVGVRYVSSHLRMLFHYVSKNWPMNREKTSSLLGGMDSHRPWRSPGLLHRGEGAGLQDSPENFSQTVTIFASSYQDFRH